jgi:hypothetical protein
MADNPQPVRKLGAREYVGGFAVMAMAFGAYSWFGGRDTPWGYQQTYGAVLFGVGVVGLVVAWLLPRERD